MKKVRLVDNYIRLAENLNSKQFCPMQPEEITCGDWCMWFNIERANGQEWVYCKDQPVAELVAKPQKGK
jgi:hypothetical protein